MAAIRVEGKPLKPAIRVEGKPLKSAIRVEGKPLKSAIRLTPNDNSISSKNTSENGSQAKSSNESHETKTETQNGTQNETQETKTETPSAYIVVDKQWDPESIKWENSTKDEYYTNKDLEAIKNQNLAIDNQFNRVSLNICPMTYRNDNTFVPQYWINEKRISYVLGDDKNGLLRSYFEKTYGLIFPYTPGITMNYQAEYESSTILHSNLSINMYKNTPPSSITVIADFTADNEYNAEYMYAAMIFLKAMTKTDFGVKAKERGDAGMPPPILYLNGWGSTYINIPVVVKSFQIPYSETKQYVYLKKYNVWVPTDIKLNITLDIQPNLEKYKYQFDLNAYKNNTLDQTSNVTLITATELVKGKQSGTIQKTLYSNNVEYFYKVRDALIQDNESDSGIEVDQTGKKDIDKIRTTFKKKSASRDVYKLSNYKKKEQFSGHGWTW